MESYIYLYEYSAKEQLQEDPAQSRICHISLASLMCYKAHVAKTDVDMETKKCPWTYTGLNIDSRNIHMQKGSSFFLTNIVSFFNERTMFL